jgi:hypothetical protein
MSLRGNFRWWFWGAVYRSRGWSRATGRWLGRQLEYAMPHLAAMGGFGYMAPPPHSTARSEPTARRADAGQR